VVFDGTGSSDPDGTIVAWDWDFGDGNFGTGETPTHTYAADGDFTVTLTVTDDAGTTDSAMTTATISPVGVVIEAEIEAPGSINAANRGRTPIEIEFDGDNMDNGMPVEIVELQCGGDVSNAMTMPERINAEDDDENEFVALFRTSDLMLTCEDTEIVCTGTLSDGTMFEGMSGIRVVRDFEGNRCKDGDDDDDDDHGRKRKHSRR
jgi:PKD repeat protein